MILFKYYNNVFRTAASPLPRYGQSLLDDARAEIKHQYVISFIICNNIHCLILSCLCIHTEYKN